MAVFQHRSAILEHQKGLRLERCPYLVVRERRGCNYRNPIVLCGYGTKVDLNVAINQMRGFERMSANDVLQLGGAMRVHGLPVGEQHVEGAVLSDFRTHRAKHFIDFSDAGAIACSTVAKLIFQGL